MAKNKKTFKSLPPAALAQAAGGLIVVDMTVLFKAILATVLG